MILVLDITALLFLDVYIDSMSKDHISVLLHEDVNKWNIDYFLALNKNTVISAFCGYNFFKFH